MTAPEVSAVVVSWNARDHLARCLDHLSASAIQHEVIVVDNGSTDGSREMLRRRDGIKVVDLDNPGFGAANNAGVAAASGAYLVFVNSDCDLSPDAMSRMIETLQSDDALGIVAPKLLTSGGTVQRSAGRKPNLATELLNKTMLHRLFPYYTYGWRYLHTASRVDWVSGACFAMRRSAFEHIGGFDEAFFMFMEDVDLCTRARAAGYGILFDPSIVAWHYGGASQRAVKTQMLVESERSVRRYYSVHGGPWTLRCVRAFSALECICRLCVWVPALAVPGWRPTALARIKAYPKLVGKRLG